MAVRRSGYRYQRTIARPAQVHGTGFVTGASVCLRFQPAPPRTGIVFQRTDLPGAPAVSACLGNVTGTNRRTTLGRAPSQVELVEHVLAALAGLRIDNCCVELNAPEPPGLDGSARGFVAALCHAGIALQHTRREVWTPEEPVTVTEGTATLALHPGPTNCLRVSYLLDYGQESPIGLQRHTHDVTPEAIQEGLAASRTFILQQEIEQLRGQGLGKRTTPADLLVFGPHGPVGNQLRFANEPARHKVLDIVGDLSLFGHDLRGHVVACRSGHSLNVALVRKLTQQMNLDRPNDHRRAA